jgi:hypothetical protein
MMSDSCFLNVRCTVRVALVLLAVLLGGCASSDRRCRGALQPINPVLPAGERTDAEDER